MTTPTNEYLVISKLIKGVGGTGNCYEFTKPFQLDSDGKLINTNQVEDALGKIVTGGATFNVTGIVATSSMGSTGTPLAAIVTNKDIGEKIRTALIASGVTYDTTLGDELLKTYTISNTTNPSNNVTNKDIGEAIRTALSTTTVTDDTTLGDELLKTYNIKDKSSAGTIVDATVLGKAIRTALSDPSVTDDTTLGDELLKTFTIRPIASRGGRKYRKPRGGKTKHRKYSSHSTKHNKNKNKKVRRTSKIIP